MNPFSTRSVVILTFLAATAGLASAQDRPADPATDAWAVPGRAEDPAASGGRGQLSLIDYSANPLNLQPTASEPTPAEPTPAEPGVDAPKEVDKSGTDPTKFLRTLGLRNEYQRLPSETSFNLTTFTYIEPFADGRMNLRLKAPLAYTTRRGMTSSAWATSPFGTTGSPTSMLRRASCSVPT